MKLSISRKITMFAASIVLIISVSIGLAVLLTGANVIIGQQEENMLKLADEGAKRIDAIITMRLQVLQELAHDDAIVSMDWERQKEYLREKIVRLEYLDMAVVQPDGTAQYILGGEQAQLGDRNYIRKAFEGQPNVSEVLVSKVTGVPVVMYAVPVESQGKVVGVLIARRDYNALREITNDLAFGVRGYSFIIGAGGTFYAHPNEELVLNQVNVFQQIDENGPLKNFGIELKKLGVGKHGILKYEYDGENRFTAISPIPNTDWSIGVGNYNRDVFAPLRMMQTIVVIVTMGFLILGVLAGGFLGRFISKPIRKLLTIVEKMANYDFTQDKDAYGKNNITRRKDEIGEISFAISGMQESISSLVRKVSETTQQVAASSQQLTSITQQSSESSLEMSGAVEEIAKGASNQAKETEEGAKHIQELSDLISYDRLNMENLNNSASEVNRLKDEGLEILSELTRKTDESKKASEIIFTAIRETSASVENIQQGSEMIRTIARQTNLLALNAAIEASRAGESGRGFAVVADEIRRLAEQSNRFANDIIKEIQELSQKTVTMVNMINQVGSIVQEQNESVAVTNRRFQGIHQAVEGMKEAIGKLNESSSSMEKKKDELIVIMNDLSAISEQFAAGTEEVASTIDQQSVSIENIAKSSEALSKLAEELQTMVAKFKY